MADLTLPAGTNDFLARHGWAGATVTPLAGDASFRRYFRVTDGARRAILMDAPPPHEDSRPFLSVAEWLHERGFAAPAIHGAAPEAGLVLLEDFGDDRMREAIDAAPAAGLPLYEAAVDVLVALARHPAGPFAPYDRAALQREAALLVEWYCPAVGLEVDLDGYAAAWEAVLGQALTDAPVTVLRDYHAENLMLVGPERRLGLLDFQDALAGHPAYDLVSLLQDARRDVEPSIEEAMLARYRAATGAGEAFMRAYHVLGAQRNAKIIGIFTRLWRRDGKERYPSLCPRVWAYLERDLSQPVLRPVAAWFDANIPPELRGDPKVLAVTAPRTAMVMAAGLGTRMRPLTDTMPKPLIEVAGTTLLDHVLDLLRDAGIERIVVNVHYFPEQIEAHLARHARDLDVQVSDERALLRDTGGGLVQALRLIPDDPFFCINADNWFADTEEHALVRMARAWDADRMDVLMLVVPFDRAGNTQGIGDFDMKADGRLSRDGPKRQRPYVWTGIQLLAKAVVTDPPAEVFSTNVFWDRAIAAGRCFGLVHDGAWFDVGYPAAIGMTEAALRDG